LKHIAAISRRNLLTQVLPGAAAAVAGVATVGWVKSADALALSTARENRIEVDELVEKAQVL
jgi:Rieske Fe-S protein